jgi:hypothetical protein
VFGSDLSFEGGDPEGGGSLRATEMITRGQALVDTPRPPGGYPLTWHINAMLVGDLPSLAAALARTPRAGSDPAALSDR